MDDYVELTDKRIQFQHLSPPCSPHPNLKQKTACDIKHHVATLLEISVRQAKKCTVVNSAGVNICILGLSYITDE